MTEKILLRKGQHHTNWDAHGLDEMLRTVGESIHTMTWNQITTWRMMADLCNHHATTLLAAATTLADHWPREKSLAAKQFLGRVVDFVDRMRAAAYAATENATAADQVANAHSQAYAKLNGIKRERDSLRYPAGGYRPLAYAKLDEAAREVMRSLDSTVAEARQRLIAPQENPISWLDRPLPPPHLRESHDAGLGGARSSTQGLTFPVTTPKTSPGDSGWNQPDLTPASPHFEPATLDADPVLATGPTPNSLPASVPLSLPGQYHVADTTGGVGVGPGGLISATPRSVGGGLVSPGSHDTSTRPPAATGRPAPSTQGVHPMTGPMAAAPMTGAGRAGGGAGVAPGGVPGNSYAARKQRGRDDGPWSAARGGPAVIEPAPIAHDHDPGPGVIGGDR